jgi:CRP/FNR family cyclic AMP-dependent transcriptional regulator
LLLATVTHPIEDIPLFEGLTAQEDAQVRGFMRRRNVAAATTLMMVDQPADVLYIVLTGTVKIHVEQADGSAVILAILGPGTVVGEMSIIESLGTGSAGRSATVVTLEESTLGWIDRTAFQACLETMPVLAINLLRILARRLRLANAQIQSLAAQDVFGRVARQLLAFGQEYGETIAEGTIRIPLRLTQSDLASLVGASRVRVNQVLVHYQQRNYISIAQNFHITIHNAAALAQRCQ